jgi:hypothetical protein
MESRNETSGRVRAKGLVLADASYALQAARKGGVAMRMEGGGKEGRWDTYWYRHLRMSALQYFCKVSEEFRVFDRGLRHEDPQFTTVCSRGRFTIPTSHSKSILILPLCA